MHVGQSLEAQASMGGSMLRRLNQLVSGLPALFVVFNYIATLQTYCEKGDKQAQRLDAFDSSLCGKASFRPWQTQTSAYGCNFPWPEGQTNYENSPEEIERAEDQLRVVDGEPALDGEFPSFVRLHLTKAGGLKTACDGTLIHNNLVLTSGHCTEDTWGMTAVLGTNWANGTGGLVVEANKWCHKWNPQERLLRDLAVVQLSEPVKYVENKLAPACIYQPVRHQDLAQCVVAGMGLNGPDNTTSDRLMTLVVRRRCMIQNPPHHSCYVTDNKGLPCPGDSGGPVYCYDKCKDKSTRAFLVGAISHGPQNACKPNSIGQTFGVADLNWLKGLFVNLVLATRNFTDLETKGIVCVVPNIKKP